MSQIGNCHGNVGLEWISLYTSVANHKGNSCFFFLIITVVLVNINFFKNHSPIHSTHHDKLNKQSFTVQYVYTSLFIVHFLCLHFLYDVLGKSVVITIVRS